MEKEKAEAEAEAEAEEVDVEQLKGGDQLRLQMQIPLDIITRY